MFSSRVLDDDLAAVRDRHAPGSPVLDVGSDFETLPPAAAEDLGLFVDALDPASYPAEWLPEAVPDLLRKHAGPAFTVGLPGDGTVVRTTQTDPPAVLVKRRAEGTPDDFLAFLVAERLVQIGCEPAPDAVGGADTAANDGDADTAANDGDAPGLPESFLPFFGARYRDLDAAIRRPGPETGESTTGFGPTDVFQVANALFDAWVGLHTRDAFASWDGEHPRLFDAWVDAGDRLSGRLGGLSAEVARGDTDFPSATEYACSAVKHDLDLPAPYGALDTAAYRDRGAAYAVAWAEKTFAALVDDEA
ncbi:hypothetical protein EXE46_01025 [Halorubrum sp. GN11_10-6_MGM]|uniref:DUF7089 family protein n=1 Tax=Halorubrum sp. GN11_10-6_MGM TaxID=2518112 RepID=UPI0010F96ECD|nr:hypothetical protein [Halorubrum sp. GN11_10-6_MGM]TKX76132.1 hypothetical protein EXE46_01025 [Halorubrum sp. GN11_10-6_MGM]